ncbi:MAG: flagellar hook-associated protein FlgK [Candidatus Eisenbacteria bacterium]|nr:flagellar hook-associated protein FlgK [Candidatus Eisenbacteria bacterium]
MSLQSMLSIARSALFTHQRSMDVTAHNIANANTPGYSRQRLMLRPATPLVEPLYTLGRGVEASTLQRSRDTFYDASYRSDNGLLGRASTLRDYLSQVESSMNEPSDSAISSSLDNLFRSFSDLSGDPANHTNRELVSSAARRLVDQLHSLATALGRTHQEALDHLNVQVTDVNALTARIADLNTKIQASGGPAHSVPDLMDQRDLLVDQLSAQLNVRVLDRGDGSIGVLAGDTLLVDGARNTELAVTTVGAGYGIAPAGGGAPIDPQSGSIKALTEVTQVKLPALRARLDQLASSLVTEFNAVHSGGFTLSGATGVDFFDPSGTTAGTIKLSAQVSASSDNIAASANGAAGNGAIAAQLAAFASTGVASLGGRTLREHYVVLAADVGLDVRNSEHDIEAQQVLVDRSEQSREAVSGVNVDEEMISLITQQQAYQAASRLVNVADQMMQDLLQML